MRGRTGGWAWAPLVLLAVSGLAAGGEDLGARPELVLLWSDPQRCVPAGVKGDLFRETAALFASWGVRLRSSEGLDSTGADDVRVVLLDQVKRDARGKRILGETHTRPLEYPAVWIFVPNVQSMLERTEGGASPGFLARALARVAAHEIGHALGLGHAPRGLMRRGLGAPELTRPWVEVGGGFERDLLAAVRPLAGEATAGRP